MNPLAFDLQLHSCLGVNICLGMYRGFEKAADIYCDKRECNGKCGQFHKKKMNGKSNGECFKCYCLFDFSYLD